LYFVHCSFSYRGVISITPTMASYPRRRVNSYLPVFVLRSSRAQTAGQWSVVSGHWSVPTRFQSFTNFTSP